MVTAPDIVYRFADFHFDPLTRTIRTGQGNVLRVGVSGARLLLALLDADGAWLSNRALLERGWPGQAVAANNLTVQMVSLRRLLGSDRTLIVNDRNAGYRIGVPVLRLRGEAGPSAPTTPETPIGPNNLPAQPPPLFGRDPALADLVEQLSRCSVTTLTGAPGIGKSAIALVAAHRLLASFPDGVYWVDVARVRQGDLLPAHIAATLRKLLAPDVDATTALAWSLAEERLLIVLDNCEHLIAPVARLASSLATNAPDLRLLVTSREPLALPDERVVPVPPLDTPAPGAPLSVVLESSSVQLLQRRIRDRHPKFSVTEDSVEAICRLLRMLEGVPMAIEVVAAGADGAEVPDINDFDQLLSTQTGGSGDSTLSACLERSVSLLAPAERRSLARVSAFEGGFDSEAAAAVLGGGVDGEPVALSLAGLVRRNLLHRSGTGQTARFQLPHLIRRHAARLLTAVEAQSVQQCHAAHIADRLRSIYWGQFSDPEDVHLNEIDAALADGLAAQAFASGSEGDPDIAAVIATYFPRSWDSFAQLSGQVAYLHAAAKRPPPGLNAADRAMLQLRWQLLDAVQGNPLSDDLLDSLDRRTHWREWRLALTVGAMQMAARGDATAAEQLLGRLPPSRPAYVATALERGLEAFAWRARAMLAGQRGDAAASLAAAAEARACYAALDQPSNGAIALAGSLLFTIRLGGPLAARRAGEEALASLAPRACQNYARATLQLNWACNLVAAGEAGAALAPLAASLRTAQAAGYRVEGCIRPVALALVALGRHEEAAPLWGYAERHVAGARLWWPPALLAAAERTLATHPHTASLIASGESLGWDALASAIAAAAETPPG